jgi:hypothetical protein
VGRAVASLIIAGIFIVAFFFFAVAVALLGVLLIVVLVRILMPSRNAHKREKSDGIEAEHSLASENRKSIDFIEARPPKD